MLDDYHTDRAVDKGRLPAGSESQTAAAAQAPIAPVGHEERGLALERVPRSRREPLPGAGWTADGRATSETAPKGRDPRLMAFVAASRCGGLLCDRDLHLEINGWERPPPQTSLLVGVHSGSRHFPFPPAAEESDLRRRPEGMNAASASPVRSSSDHTRRAGCWFFHEDQAYARRGG